MCRVGLDSELSRTVRVCVALCRGSCARQYGIRGDEKWQLLATGAVARRHAKQIGTMSRLVSQSRQLR